MVVDPFLEVGPGADKPYSPGAGFPVYEDLTPGGCFTYMLELESQDFTDTAARFIKTGCQGPVPGVLG